jgi:APA family basic amino acid/polyamine antiporter
VTFTGGEIRDPGRNLPRALLLGCGSVVGLYLLANVTYVVTLTLEQIQHAPQDRVGTLVMQEILGPRGTIVMTVAILISTFGCLNGLILAGARVYYAMARDGLFFDAAGTTNRRRVPAVALAAQGAWASLLTLPVTVTIDKASGAKKFGNLYSQLLEYIIPADLAFYALMVGAVILLRRRAPDLERPYRTLGYPVPAIIYLGLAVLLVLDFVLLAPETSGIGSLIVLAGIPVYFVWSRTAPPQPRSLS